MTEQETKAADATGKTLVSAQWLHDFARNIAATEREACAKVCDDAAERLYYGDAGLELWQAYCDKKMECEDLREEIERLQRIIDSRPAINAGLPGTYIDWSRGVMQAEIARALGHDDAA